MITSHSFLRLKRFFLSEYFTDAFRITLSVLTPVTVLFSLGYPEAAIAQLAKGQIESAAATAQALQVPGLEIAATGPYVNARFATLPFTQEVIDATRSAGAAYGGSDVGHGKTVVIDPGHGGTDPGMVVPDGPLRCAGGSRDHEGQRGTLRNGAILISISRLVDTPGDGLGRCRMGRRDFQPGHRMTTP